MKSLRFGLVKSDKLQGFILIFFHLQTFLACCHCNLNQCGRGMKVVMRQLLYRLSYPSTLLSHSVQSCLYGYSICCFICEGFYDLEDNKTISIQITVQSDWFILPLLEICILAKPFLNPLPCFTEKSEWIKCQIWRMLSFVLCCWFIHVSLMYI